MSVKQNIRPDKPGTMRSCRRLCGSIRTIWEILELARSIPLSHTRKVIQSQWKELWARDERQHSGEVKETEPYYRGQQCGELGLCASLPRAFTTGLTDRKDNVHCFYLFLLFRLLCSLINPLFSPSRFDRGAKGQKQFRKLALKRSNQFVMQLV